MTINNLNNNTENELRKDAEKLRAIVRSGEATIGQANLLAEIEIVLRRFEAVVRGRTF